MTMTHEMWYTIEKVQKQVSKGKLTRYLITAVITNNSPMVELFIQLGADPTARHYKAFKMAVEARSISAFKTLLRYNYDISKVKDELMAIAEKNGYNEFKDLINPEVSRLRVVHHY